jgi:aerobic-type carbon monoxide dehydrogenase small subunit (CoxS/CutS family)
MTTSLHINGTPRTLAADPARSLLSVLRDDLALTACKYGCGEGECGACTVLVDGQAIRSCITPLSECGGKKITTAESLAQNGQLHPLQQAFIDCGAMQCGYCTPGMIMSGVALLKKHPQPSRDQIIAEMNGNICRCGTYARVISAIEQAAGAAK